jgi:hypothetical protein
MARDKELMRDAYLAYESVRRVAEVWGIGREQFAADWQSHVYGEKTGLEREAAFPSRRKEAR